MAKRGPSGPAREQPTKSWELNFTDKLGQVLSQLPYLLKHPARPSTSPALFFIENRDQLPQGHLAVAEGNLSLQETAVCSSVGYYLLRVEKGRLRKHFIKLQWISEERVVTEANRRLCSKNLCRRRKDGRRKRHSRNSPLLPLLPHPM